MADEVTRHYKSLLASHYTWMFGVPPATKVAEQKQLLTYLLAKEMGLTSFRKRKPKRVRCRCRQQERSFPRASRGRLFPT
jgi:hypothetical protein